jgi:chromosome segregation ATPase
MSSIAKPVSKSEIMNYFNHWKHFRSSFEGFQLIMEGLFNDLDHIQDVYIKQHAEYEKYKSDSEVASNELHKQLEEMESKYNSVKEELANLKKVSIYTHLSKEMDELRNYNKILEKQLKQQRSQPAITLSVVPVVQAKTVEETSNVNDEKVNIDTEREDAYEEVEEVEDDTDETNTESGDEVEEVEEVEEADGEEGEDNNEEVEDEEDDGEAEEDEEPEIEYESRKIGKKYYYVSNEEPVGIYLVIKETGEVGDKVGEYEDDKPVFYK